MTEAAAPVGELTGGCLCGAVRFRVSPRERAFGACHCSMCRRWSGGPFLAVECERRASIDDETNLGVYRSSSWAERCFCTRCGSVLFYRLQGEDFDAVSLEALDDRTGFVFAGQVFIDEKPDYYDFANTTETMTGPEVFAAFGAAGAGQAGESR